MNATPPSSPEPSGHRERHLHVPHVDTVDTEPVAPAPTDPRKARRALIGSYVILRFGALGEWAKPGVVLNIPVTAFNTFLREIRQNGVWADMVDRWMTKRSQQMPRLPSPPQVRPTAGRAEAGQLLGAPR